MAADERLLLGWVPSTPYKCKHRCLITWTQFFPFGAGDSGEAPHWRTVREGGVWGAQGLWRLSSAA